MHIAPSLSVFCACGARKFLKWAPRAFSLLPLFSLLSKRSENHLFNLFFFFPISILLFSPKTIRLLELYQKDNYSDNKIKKDKVLKSILDSVEKEAQAVRKTNNSNLCTSNSQHGLNFQFHCPTPSIS